MNFKSDTIEKWKLIFKLTVISVIPLLFFSQCSFLYPINEWADIDCYMTVSKGLMHGIVPYRDVFDHKGLLLYFIYGLATLISSRSMHGMFLVEILCNVVFLYYAYKIILLFKGRVSMPLLFIMNCIIISTASFQMGGSVEELALPIIAYSMYQFLVYIRIERKTPDGSVPLRKVYVIGLGAGAILWTKYTVLGAIAGIVIALVIDYTIRRKYRELLKSAAVFILGVLTVSLPLLVYLLANGALADMWQIYVYNNIFEYQTIGLPIKNRVAIVIYNWAGDFIIVFGAWYMIRSNIKDRAMAIYSALIFIIMFITSFCLRMAFIYYLIPLDFFAIFFVIMVESIAEQVKLKASVARLIGVAASVAVFALGFFTSESTYLLGTAKSDIALFKIADRIHETEDSSLIYYDSLDLGIYTAADTIVEQKYYCVLNTADEKMSKERERYIKEGLTKYIISTELIDDEILETMNDSYKLVESYNYSKSISKMLYLYERMD